MSVDKSNLSTLLSSATLVLVGTLLGALATLFERIIVGRLLSPDAYGEFSIGLAVLTLGSTVALVGLNQGVPRYMARFDTIEDVRGTWWTGLIVGGGTAVLLSVILLVERSVIAPQLFNTNTATPLFELFVLTIPFYVMLEIGISAIRGLENTRFKIYTYDLFFPVARITLLVGLLLAGFDIIATGYSYLAITVIAAVIAHIFLNRLLPLRGSKRLHVKKLFGFSAPLMISAVMSILLTRTDTLMLGYFQPSRIVGIYNAAFPLAQALIIVLSAFGYLYLPLISRLDRSNERDEIERVYELTTKWIYIVTFPAFALLVAFPNEIIAIVFGAQYAVDPFLLRILAIGFFTDAAAGRNRETLTSLGFPRTILLINGLAFVVNATLNLMWIPEYSYRGAAVASVISFILINFLGCWILYYKTTITPFNSQSVRTFLSLPIILLPPILFLARRVQLSLVTIPVFLVTVGITSIAVVALIGGIETEDIIIIEFIEEQIGLRIPHVRQLF
jgi:O-antigen/teichoic acid export membrane protein